MAAKTQTKERSEAVERVAVAEAKRLEEEAERLEGQLQAAHKSAAGAEGELAAVRARREEIGLSVFEGDEDAKKELAELRARAASAEETLEVSRGAADQLGRLLEETKGQLAEAQLEVHRERYRSLREQSAALDPERDELSTQLHAVLERQDELLGQALQALNKYDQAAANRAVTYGETGVRSWVRERFARWVG